ncbi:MAG: hypothetical protein QM737_12985 [Ferruginibacter sp.]
MKTLKNIFFYLAIPLTLFISCKKDHTEPGPEPAPLLGKITGKIVAANNITPISAATVFTHNDGQLYITHADQNGDFSLDAPAGNRHITIQSGDGSMFRTEIDVVVKENQTTAIASQPVSLTQVATLAYIPGIYDKIENILVDSLGYTATAITWHTLDTLPTIAAYDAIFINCTSSSDMPIDRTLSDQNLGDYVANGGSLYVSDWAVGYLVGTATSAADPCSIHPTGGFIADSLLCTRRTGYAGSIMNTNVISASLQAYLNQTTINEIYYNLGVWEQINYADPNFWETLVADQTGQPLAIRTNLYTNPNVGSFHTGSNANNENSLICVMDNNGQHITLSVKNADAPLFIANGATSGSCDNTLGNGRIYFTTFHNEPNGVIAPDIKNILSFMILNL